MDFQMLTVPEVAQRLETTIPRVRAMIREHRLLATRREDGVLVIPEVFLAGNQPVAAVFGTATVLIDGGYSEAEIYEWMFTVHPELGQCPAFALKAGRAKAVRRIAGQLAW